MIEIEFEHVDGTTPANERSEKIQKLRETEENKCKVLSNVRCLSEGVDVPSLDAVIFLSSKKSKIDIIQAVGRALRKPKNSSKKYGYIVVPMIISNDQDAEIESGSRAPIAITILVKNPESKENAKIFYYDIGDYLFHAKKNLQKFQRQKLF